MNVTRVPVRVFKLRPCKHELLDKRKFKIILQRCMVTQSSRVSPFTESKSVTIHPFKVKRTPAGASDSLQYHCDTFPYQADFNVTRAHLRNFWILLVSCAVSSLHHWKVLDNVLGCGSLTNLKRSLHDEKDTTSCASYGMHLLLRGKFTVILRSLDNVRFLTFS
jgi:hypothetical protein